MKRRTVAIADKCENVLASVLGIALQTIESVHFNRRDPHVGGVKPEGRILLKKVSGGARALIGRSSSSSSSKTLRNRGRRTRTMVVGRQPMSVFENRVFFSRIKAGVIGPTTRFDSLLWE